MGKDVLVILMVAFGLFAIVMFVLFFIYLKKYYNSRHINENYQDDTDDEIDNNPIEEREYENNEPVSEDIHIESNDIKPVEEVVNQEQEVNIDNENGEFIPIRKK